MTVGKTNFPFIMKQYMHKQTAVENKLVHFKSINLIKKKTKKIFLNTGKVTNDLNKENIN